MSNLARLWLWGMAVWLLLTWTVQPEQIICGAIIALCAAALMAGLGPVAAPWRLLDPRVLWAAARLLLASCGRIVRANISLARRIWTPSLPLRSGMVIVPTDMQTEGGVGGLGLITSLIVDNQIVDLDTEHDLLQFHAVDVGTGSREDRREVITGPTERLLAPLTERRT